MASRSASLMAAGEYTPSKYFHACGRKSSSIPCIKGIFKPELNRPEGWGGCKRKHDGMNTLANTIFLKENISTAPLCNSEGHESRVRGPFKAIPERVTVQVLRSTARLWMRYPTMFGIVFAALHGGFAWEMTLPACLLRLHACCSASKVLSKAGACCGACLLARLLVTFSAAVEGPVLILFFFLKKKKNLIIIRNVLF